MESTYTPVPYECRETIAEQISSGASGKVFFFNAENAVDSAEGRLIKMEEVAGQGIFLTLEPHTIIRIDRIITSLGKPGAAYDEYDSFANQCLACTGGYELVPGL